MKKNLLLILACVCVLMLNLTSCVSSKKIVYFQGADTVFAQAQTIMQQYDMRVKPADNIMVKITCDQPELLQVFTQDVLMGATGTNTNNINQSGTINTAYGYTVQREGHVSLPVIGNVQVAGLTVEECAHRIENIIKEREIIRNPEVKVSLMNARVAVIGAVRSPKVVSLTSERNSIIDVLAQAGDIDDHGLRKNLKLFREVGGKRMMYNIDITQADVFTNPAYYVQQNDIIYVEPNRSKSIKSSAFYTYLTAGGSILGVVSSIVSLYLLIDKEFK